MKDNKNLIIGMLCTVVCVMAVAYAAFSTTLTINGTASIDSKWDVTITSASCPTKTPVAGGAANSVKAEAKKDSDTVATITMEFTQPGDVAECQVVYTNGGTLNATLSHTVTGIDGAALADGATTTANNAIKFTITGADEVTSLAKNGDTHTITVRGEYLNSVTSQPADADTKATIKIVSIATQAGIK